MNASDVMTRDVITVRPDTPVAEIIDLLLARGISGVPVVEADGRLAGIVSEGDLLRRSEIGTEKKRGTWLSFFTGSATLAGDYVRAHAAAAKDVMTAGVVSVGPTASLAEIADVMEDKHIKRVPVVDGGKLVGLISRSNLLRAAASRLRAGTSAAGADDRTIREALLAELTQHPWGRRTENSIVVTDGIVHLWGLVTSPEESRALELAASRTPGAKAVQNHTIVLSEQPYQMYPGI